MTLGVCHLISGDLWAGAEVMAFHLLQGLHRRRDIDLFVIVLNRGTLSDRLQQEGISTCIISETAHSFQAIVRLAWRMVAKREPQVLHSHRYKENALAYLVSLALRRRVALIATQHGMPEHGGGWRSAVSRLKSNANLRLLESKFSSTVAVSADIKASLVREHGFAADAVEVIHNGVISAPGSARPARGETFTIGSAGRLVPVKDFRLMVEIAHLLKERGRKIRFELAGDGPMRPEIEQLVADRGLAEEFAILGFVEDIDSFYRGLDVYVNTSLHEGIPMSVLEAMSRGIPVVVPDVGGLKEIVADGVGGFAVSDRSADAFAQRCSALYDDAGLRESMSREARQVVAERFSNDRMVDEYAALYRKAERR